MLEGQHVLARYPVDPDLLALGREVGAWVQLRTVGRRQPRIVEGGIATVDYVGRNRLWAARIAGEHGIVAVEMEGAAIAGACHEAGVPFMAVRAISDVIGSPWQWLTMIRYLVPAQRNAERLVFGLVRRLRDEG